MVNTSAAILKSRSTGALDGKVVIQYLDIYQGI
jgi:hypothetical protein